MMTPKYSLIYEILRSFTTLARTLSLSQAVAELNITRQTIRRHIRALEEIRGEPLLLLEGQRYSLTKSGEKCLEESMLLLAGFQEWLKGETGTSLGRSGLQATSFQNHKGLDFRAQQHPLLQLWRDGPPLLREGFKAWAAYDSQFEPLSASPLWDYLVVYRPLKGNWLIISIGEKSAYSTWVNRSWVRSAVGRPVTDSPTSPEMTAFVSATYDEALLLGSPRLDHIYTQVERTMGAGPAPIAYQRLLLPLVYPDRSVALANLVTLTNAIDIPDLPADKLPIVPEDLVMNFQPPPFVASR
mgnify:FL=1|tara:strand:- start:2523 stop:3419 length:897 start_codon:yes stop_codon:yes gene_type:complete